MVDFLREFFAEVDLLAFALVLSLERFVVFEFEQALVFPLVLLVVFVEQALVFDVDLQLLLEPSHDLLVVFDVFIFSPFCSTIIICNLRQNMHIHKKICKKI